MVDSILGIARHWHHTGRWLVGPGLCNGGGISPATLATNNGGVIRNRGADNDDGSAFARLDREGRIAVGAGADLVGNILGVGFGVWLALRGAGAWSLVGQNVAIFLIRAAVINAVAFKMPVLEFHPSRLLAHFAVGGLMLGVRICDFGGRIIESMYLVHAFGTAKLGLYVFSNQVPRFISGAVSNPLWLSLYVRALREDGATTIALLRQFSRLLCMILFPVTALFLATGHILVPVFLGPKWAYAIPLLQILLPAYVLNALGSQCGAVLLAYNRYEIQLHCTIALTVGRVLVVCLGPWIGLISIAYGVLGVNAVYAAMMMIRSAAITGSTLVPLIRGLIGPLVASVFGGMMTWAWLRYWGDSVGCGFSSLIAGTIAYGVAIVLFDRKHLVSDLTILKTMLRPYKASPAM